jgi:hypothetical protein
VPPKTWPVRPVHRGRQLVNWWCAFYAGPLRGRPRIPAVHLRIPALFFATPSYFSNAWGSTPVWRLNSRAKCSALW